MPHRIASTFAAGSPAAFAIRSCAAVGKADRQWLVMTQTAISRSRSLNE
ncbi:MAG: hypothetical protein KIS73_20180 [Enhydrobacter sp.]|nr:hypothetical protein [Enhydrobacter sp.]